MTWSEIALLSLTILVSVIPIAGNVAIKVCHSKAAAGGSNAPTWATREAFLIRWVPIAVAASRSKTREEAIAVVVDEILNPETATAPSMRATQAALRVLPTVPVPDGLAPPKPPVPPVAPLLCLALLCGCTAAQLKEAGKALAPVLAGAVCDLAEKDDRQARFKCHTLVDEGSAALGKMSSDQRAEFRRAHPSAEFEVTVPIDQADDFAAKNGGK